MARPIKETPILFGNDARRFEARMKERRRDIARRKRKDVGELQGNYGNR